MMRKRGDAGEGVAVSKPLDFWSGYVDGYTDTREHNRGQIDDVRKPVTPAGEKAVLFSKAAFCPQIDASFAGPLLG